MKNLLAQLLSFLLLFDAGVAGAATPAGIPDTLMSAPQGLTAVTLAFIRQGTTPTAFNKYAHGIPLAVLAVQEAPFPQGYRSYRVHDDQKAYDYFVVSTPRQSSFVIYPTGQYIEGWGEPLDKRLTKIEELLAPALRGYRMRELRNSLLYSAAGKATVELLVTEGMPSETHSANYVVRLMIFPPGVTVLALDAPCEWWTATPPPGWRAALLSQPLPARERACEARWIEVPHV